MSNKVICAQKLGMLEGDPFQQAITSLLGKNFVNFQPIPDAPHGDGGLDGLVNDELGYCCYGIEDVPSFAAKELNDKLVLKFKKDLMRLLEFDPDVMSKFVAKENPTLAAVLPQDVKLKHIHLVCNHFGSNTAVGTLKTFFKKAKKKSKCRFIADQCSVSIEGPSDITNRLTVTPDFHAQLEQSAVAKWLATPKPSTSVPASISVFEEKMQVLEKQFSVAKVAPIKTTLEKRWLEHLGLLEKLNGSVPREHVKILRIVAQIREEASLELFGVAPANAIERMLKYQATLCERLEKEVPLSESAARSLAGQVIAMLVGECGIDWR